MWQDDEYELSDEAVRRLEQREVTLANIGEAIVSGRIIDERRRGYAHASHTIVGWANREVAGLNIGTHALVVACFVPDLLRIITVYWQEES